MTTPYPVSLQAAPTTDEEFISAVVAHVPGAAERARVETDLVRRLRSGETARDLMARYGDPIVVAESYVAMKPLESAPFFRRLAAAVIDIPSVMASGLAFFYFGWKLIGTGESFITAIVTGRPLAIGLCFATLFLMSPLYYIIAETTTSQTVGKALMGIRTVRESGVKISLGQALVRQIPLIFSFIIVDAAFALFTSKKQRLFELLSKTRVVRAR